MREIKFRGFEPVEKKWIISPGFFLFPDGKITLKIGENEEGNLITSPINAETLGQFTGLKDKNGKDIYEGDICLILYTDWPSNSSDMPLDEYLKSISHKGIIEYHDFSYYIMIKNRYDELSKNSLDYGKHGRIEVIGNIHENSELL